LNALFEAKNASLREHHLDRVFLARDGSTKTP